MATTGSTLKRSVVVAIVMVALSGCDGSTTSQSTAQGTPATASAEATAEPVSAKLTGGRYLFGPFGDPSVSIAATGPDGWFGYPDWAMDGPKPVHADAPTGIAISFFTADGLYSDPCHWDVQGTGSADVGDVKVGPTVDDMVAALRANTYYTSTVAKPVTIDGYEGQELELQLPNHQFTKCDNETGDDSGHAFVFSGPGLYVQGPANRWHVYILDVAGTRLISVILSYPKTAQSDLDLAQSVIDAMDIQT